jgi:hypothetical protein
MSLWGTHLQVMVEDLKENTNAQTPVWLLYVKFFQGWGQHQVFKINFLGASSV